jgi:hypothetical protein
MAEVNKKNSAAKAAAELNKAPEGVATEKSINDIDVVYEVVGANPAKVKENLLVRFIVSPTGRFNLAYFEGDEVALPMAFAAELIELGFAEAIGTKL